MLRIPKRKPDSRGHYPLIPDFHQSNFHEFCLGSVSKFIFPGTNRRENIDIDIAPGRVSRISLCCLPNRRLIPTQKWIDLTLDSQCRRQAGQSRGALPGNMGSIFGDQPVIRLDHAGKTQISLGIFMSTKNPCFWWKASQSRERTLHLLRRPFKQPPATRREKRIAAEQQAVPRPVWFIISKVSLCVPGNPDHLKTHVHSRQFDNLEFTLTQWMRQTNYFFSGRPIHSCFREFFAQGGNSRNMIGMMMCHQHGHELE